MSVHGLEIVNAAGGLVLSTNAFGLNYIGKATYYTTVANSSSSAGYIAYRITSATPPVVFIGLADGDNWYSLMSITNVSGSTWEIRLLATSGVEGSSTSSGTALAYAAILSSVDLYCFARPTSVSGSYGLALYDSSGTLAWDLTRPILALKEVLSFGLGVQTQSPSISTLAVLGDPRLLRHKSYGTGPFRAFEYDPAWSFQAGVLRRAGVRVRFLGVDDVADNAQTYYATDAMVIDTTGLT